MTVRPAHRCPVRRQAHAGFTLVEVLVAFVVLALVTVTLQRGVIESRAGLMRASSRDDAESVLRSLMTGALGADVLSAGRLSGSLGGFAWTIDVEPLDLGAPASGEWVPARVEIQVSGNLQRRDLEVVRLIRATP